MSSLQTTIRRELRLLRGIPILVLFLGAANSVLHAQRPGQSPRKYEPTIESLQRHPLPAWFEDAKLGVLMTWGLFSVPAYAPPSGELGKVDYTKWFAQNPYAEWYENSIKIKESPSWEYHVKKYGGSFTYSDFIPLFQKASRQWDPDEWVRILSDAGIRYVVLTSKFADGYPMWPTAVHHPYLPVNHLAAERDYVGELTEAVRRGGLKMGIYYCGGMDWSFIPDPVRTFRDVFRTIPQSEEYIRVADAHWKELLSRYQPDILWNDISYPTAGDAKGIIAAYFNEHPEAVANNRFGLSWSDYITPEYTNFQRITLKKWETCRGLGYSFGYNAIEGPEDMLSGDELVDLLVDIVSKNGNLMLGIGPAADGSISFLQLERLQILGGWLKVNGEAIYGTRPWVSPEGKTSEGASLRFTRRGDSIYAILLDRPNAAAATITSLWAEPDTTISLVGADGNLSWTQQGKDLKIDLPADLPESEAYALRITPIPFRLLKESEIDYTERRVIPDFLEQ